MKKNNLKSIFNSASCIIPIGVLAFSTSQVAAAENSKNIFVKSNARLCAAEYQNDFRRIKNYFANKKSIDAINEIKNYNSECLVKLTLLSPEDAKIIFTRESMLDAIENLSGLINADFERNLKEIYNISAFINIGYFLQKNNSYHIKNFHLNSENKEDNTLQEKLAKISHDYAILIFNKQEKEKNYLEIKDISRQIFLFISSARTYAESIPLIEYITANTKHFAKENSNLLHEAILPIQQALMSSHDAGGIYFKNDENRVKFEKIILNILDIVRNEKDTLSDKLYRNYIREAGRFLRYNVKLSSGKNLKDEIISAFTDVLKHTSRKNRSGNEQPGTDWIEVVSALEEYNISNEETCNKFLDKNKHDICNTKSTLSKTLFPNRHKYDEGKIIFYSSLSKAETDKLYLAIKETEATFKTATLTLDPVKNDPNDRVQIFIYKNKAEFEKYRSFISDADPSDVSGFYVEKVGSIYTYKMDEMEDLELVTRHEFVHYLNARYLVQGIDGNTSAFVKKWSRMQWFEEGMAEFLKNGSQFQGISLDLDNFGGITEKNFHPLNEIINSSLDVLPTNVLYNQSSALVAFLYNEKRSIFNDIISAVKTNNVKEFDRIMQFLPLLKDDYKKYVFAKKEILSKSNKQKKIYNQNFFAFNQNTLNYITRNLESEFNKNGLNVQLKKSCSLITSEEFSNEQARFLCSWSFNNKNNDINYIKNKENIINLSLANLVRENQSFSNLNCSSDLINLTCEGPLKSESNQIILFSNISKNIRDEINKRYLKEKNKTFKGSENHFYFFVGDSFSDTLYTSQRRIEGQNYQFAVNQDPEKGKLKVNSNGEIFYKSSNKTDDDYKKVTGIINIKDSDNTKTSESKDHAIKLNIFKLKELDPRMFIDTIYVDEDGYAGISIYRDEFSLNNRGDDIRLFDSEFRYKYMNDLDFIVVKQPNKSNTFFTGRYILSYHALENKININDKLVVKVFKHGRDLGEIEIKIRSKFEDKNYTKNLNKNFQKIESKEIILEAFNLINGYIYEKIEHELTGGKHYNYSFIREPNCKKSLLLTNYGSFTYQPNYFCPYAKTDYAEILITAIDNNSEEPIMKLNITFLHEKLK